MFLVKQNPYSFSELCSPMSGTCLGPKSLPKIGPKPQLMAKKEIVSGAFVALCVTSILPVGSINFVKAF